MRQKHFSSEDVALAANMILESMEDQDFIFAVAAHIVGIRNRQQIAKWEAEHPAEMCPKCGGVHYPHARCIAKPAEVLKDEAASRTKKTGLTKSSR